LYILDGSSEVTDDVSDKIFLCTTLYQLSINISWELRTEQRALLQQVGRSIFFARVLSFSVCHITIIWLLNFFSCKNCSYYKILTQKDTDNALSEKYVWRKSTLGSWVRDTPWENGEDLRHPYFEGDQRSGLRIRTRSVNF